MKVQDTIWSIVPICMLYLMIGGRIGFAENLKSKEMKKLVIETDGYGHFGMDKTGEQLKQEAIADAKRKALENAWTKIMSRTRIENNEMVIDLIESEAAGFVKVLEMKDIGLEKNNRYHVWIKAEVNYSLQPAIEEDTREKKKGKLSVEVDFFFEGDDGKPYPIRNGMVMYSNDNYSMYVKPDQNCYIYIFQQDSTGKIYSLFPDPDVPYTNPLKKGGEYWIPDPNCWFFLDENLGKEWLYIVASKEKSSKLEKLVPAGGKKMPVSRDEFTDTIKTMGRGGIRSSKVSKVKLPERSLVDVLSAEKDETEFIHSIWFWHK